MLSNAMRCDAMVSPHHVTPLHTTSHHTPPQEGLNWSDVSYRDNQSVVDLIAKRPKGLLILLEEHALINRQQDDRLLLAAFDQVGKSPEFNYLITGI